MSFLDNLKGSFSTNHTHSDMGSNIRMLDCISRVTDIVDRAIELNYCGISVTEHESITSHIAYMKYIKELREKEKLPQGFKIAYGNEIYMVNDIEMCKARQERYHHFIVVAKDKYGHEIIRRLSSKAWENSYFTGKMRRTPISKEQLKQIMEEHGGKGHIQVSTACLGNEIAPHVLRYLEDGNIISKHNIHNYIKFIKEVFGEENVFLEIQPSDNEEQIAYNKFVFSLSKAYNLPIQITTDVHYTKKEHRPIHASFLNSRDGDRETDIFYKTCYMMEIEEMWDYCKDYLTEEQFSEAVLNTQRFISQVEDYDLFHDTIVPEKNIDGEEWSVQHILKDYYEEYEYIKKYAYSEHDQDRYFLAEIEKGLLKKDVEITEEVIDRLNKEMTELWLISERLGQRLSSYYNLVQYLVDIIWRVSVMGASRGSVAGWYSAYLMDIHQMDSLEYGLSQYWRHIERNKISLPDIDVDASGDKKAQILAEVKKELGEENVLNVLTLKTEKTKSAVLTVMRGIGVNNDEAQYIASLIEQERGFLFSLKDTWYGNEEKDRKPNTQFINEINKLSEEKGVDVKEALFMIEGIVSGYGSHACALNIYNNGYIKQNSLMLAPNGLPITAWTYHDSEEVGDLKVDFLSTDAVSKLQLTLEYLLKDNVIEWQGSLRDTYNKYLHPDVVNKYDNPIMWEKMNALAIPSLFQFGDSEVGRTAMKKVKPTNIYELATANSLMRLMAQKGEITPLDKYVLYKNDISLAFEEMDKYGLNEQEREVAKELISQEYYLCTTQEGMMMVLMHDKVGGFDRKQSDTARKLVGKKEMAKIPKLREEYFDCGRKLGTRENLLDYMWDVCILPQLGYSFSILHTTGYSMIAVQEAYLATKYNPLYWACAVLTSNSGSIYDEEEDYEGVEEEIVELEEEEEEEKKKTVTNYDKVARAIGDLKSHNIKVSPPYINKANFSFTPDVKGNQIIYSLKAISGVSDETAEAIVKNRAEREYSSFEDLIARVNPKKKEIISLIKAGCFDEFEADRVKLMTKYVESVIGVKTSINGQNIPYLIKSNLVPSEYHFQVRLHRYKKYIYSKQFFHCIDEETSKNKNPHKWYKLNKVSEDFFNEHLIQRCKEGVEYCYTDEGSVIVRNEKLNKVIDSQMKPLIAWMGTKEAVDLFNYCRFREEWDKYCEGSISKWEMEALSYYYHEHELANVDNSKYMFDNFFELSEDPIKEGEYTYRKKVYDVYALSRICGTVIAKNNTKHLVSILTPQGVVDVKFYGGAYSHYNKQISRVNADGTKTVIEKPWFKRGSLLSFVGYRRGDVFVPKTYRDSIFNHTVQRITYVSEEGTEVIFKSEREVV